MINKTILITLTSACVMGFGSSRLVKSWRPEQANSSPSEQENRTITKSLRERPDKPKTLTREIENLLSKLSRLDKDQQRAKADEMDSDEIVSLLEAISSRNQRFNLNGLVGPDETPFYVLFNSLILKDSEAAIRWVLTLESESDHRQLLREVVLKVGETDLERGLALLDQISQTHGKRIAQPWPLLDEAAAEDAEALLRIFRGSSTQIGPTMGPTETYAEDFDFETALNGLADLQASVPEGEGYIAIPDNLLGEWVKRDPRSAMEWALLGREVDFNTGMHDFMVSYKAMASDAELVAMVSEVHSRTDDHQHTWNALTGIGKEAVLERFLEEATVEGGQNQLMAALLNESMDAMRKEDRVVRQMLLERMNSEQRMEFFMSEDAPKPATPKVSEQLRVQLTGLGHSPEEIDRMMTQ